VQLHWIMQMELAPQAQQRPCEPMPQPGTAMDPRIAADAKRHQQIWRVVAGAMVNQ
jgi:hypothetical protein